MRDFNARDQSNGMSEVQYMFEKQPVNQDTRYFIIDTHGGKDLESAYDDKDFVRYAWELSRFGKVRAGDLFIYRRPMKDSEFKEFYFFGAGVFGTVQSVSNAKNKPVVSYVKDYVKFDHLILASQEELVNYKWHGKVKKIIIGCISLINME